MGVVGRIPLQGGLEADNRDETGGLTIRNMATGNHFDLTSHEMELIVEDLGDVLNAVVAGRFDCERGPFTVCMPERKKTTPKSGQKNWLQQLEVEFERSPGTAITMRTKRRGQVVPNSELVCTNTDVAFAVYRALKYMQHEAVTVGSGLNTRSGRGPGGITGIERQRWEDLRRRAASENIFDGDISPEDESGAP